MRRPLLVPLLGSLLLAGSGCGTVLNFFNGESAGPKRIYGGVQMDCQMAAEQLKDHRVDGPPLVLLTLFDLPLSVLGDTLTLPLVLADRLHGLADWWHEVTADQPPPGPPPPPLANPAPR
jgi:uncharacterized protein YceK